MEEKVSPLEFLSQEFESEQTTVKVNAIRRLPIIASVMGESSQTKGQILGFLENILNSNEDDEVLFGMAEALLSLTRYFKLKMIFILEKLVCIEETVVRLKAVECYLNLVKYLKKSEIREVLIPNIKKLAESNNFTTKISSINIMTEIYPSCSDDDKKVIRSKLNHLFTEDSLMVRRVLASKLGTLCNYMSKSIVISELINSFKNLTDDDNSEVRILTIQSLVDLAKNLNDEENKIYMIPMIIKLTSDKSWCVKFNLAKNFADITKAVGKEVSDSLVSVFVTLLKDPENEVRKEAVRSLSNFIQILKPDKIMIIVTQLEQLAKDNVALVRCRTAETVQNILKNKIPNLKIELKSLMGSKIDKIFEKLTNDPDQEVQMETFIALTYWANVCDIETMRKHITFPNKVLFSTSYQWNLKKSAAQCILKIISIYKDKSIFNKYFKKSYLEILKIHSNDVRTVAIKFIPKFTEFVDENYILSYIGVEMMQIITGGELYSSPIKISSIYGIGEIYKICKNETQINEIIKSNIIPLLDSTNDGIRLVTTKVLIMVSQKSKKEDMKAILTKKFSSMKTSDPYNEIKFILSR